VLSLLGRDTVLMYDMNVFGATSSETMAVFSSYFRQGYSIAHPHLSVRFAECHFVILGRTVRCERSASTRGTLASLVGRETSQLVSLTLTLGKVSQRNLAPEDFQQRCEGRNAGDDDSEIDLHDGPLDDGYRVCVVLQIDDGVHTKSLNDGDEESQCEQRSDTDLLPQGQLQLPQDWEGQCDDQEVEA